MDEFVYTCFNEFKHMEIPKPVATSIVYGNFPLANMIRDYEYIIKVGTDDTISHITFVFDLTGINLYVFESPHMPLHDTIIRNTCMFVYFLNKINRRKNVTIVLAAMDKTKELPINKGATIQAIHVNGGATYVGTGKCIVYRKEELFKVLLHELMHVYGIDETSDIYALDQKFARKYNVTTSRLGLTEAYNDTMTCLMYGGIYIMLKNPGISRKKYDEQFTHVTNHMWAYMTLTAAKIYNHYNVKPYGPIIEDTHVFAYYICKAALLSNWPSFIRTFGIQTLAKNTSKFGEFLEQALDNPQFIKILNDKCSTIDMRTDINKRMIRMLNVELPII